VKPAAATTFRWALSAFFATILLGVALSVSCGGGGGSSGGSGGNPKTYPGTPAGTYTVTVTGASGSLQDSTTMTLTVQ
jgi:hypothetical protein